MAAISSYLVTAPSKKYCFRKHFKKNVFIDIFIIKSWNFHPDLVNGALWIQDEYLNNPGWIACIDKRCLIDQFKSFPMLPMVPMPLEKRWVGASDQEMKHRHILRRRATLWRFTFCFSATDGATGEWSMVVTISWCGSCSEGLKFLGF